MRGRIVTLAAVVAALTCAAPAGGYVYWANSTASGTLSVPAIARAGLDGTGALQSFIPVQPPSGPTNPCGVAVDDTHVYWANASGSTGSGTTIGRARLDGTSVEPEFISGANGPCGVAVDDRYVYWANYAGDSLGRARLDGSDVEPAFLPTGSGSGPCGVAVDGTYVYWANLQSGFTFSSIGRAKLDGSEAEPEFVPAVAPCGVAVNATHVYWANYIQGYGSSVGRALIDGSEPQLDFIEGDGDRCPAAPCLAGPVGVAVDARHVYWANQAADSIGRAELDGGEIERRWIAGASSPVGVAVDALADAAGPTPTPTPTPEPTPAPAGDPPPPASDMGATAARVRVRRVQRERRRGTIRLVVAVSGPGALFVRALGVRPVTRRALRAQTLTATVRTRGATARRLRRTGRAHVRLRVTFTPALGTPSTTRKHVTFIRTKGRR